MKSINLTKLFGRNAVIKALTLSDFSVWPSSSMIAVIYTLFVLDQINGATVFHAGVSSMIFILVSAFVNIPIGRFMDGIKGYIDETYMLAASSFIRGISIILMAFSTEIWQIYLLQSFLGIARSMNLTAWRVIFNKFLEDKNKAEQWSMYDTVIAVGLATATLIGGYLGITIPYSYIVFIGGVTTLIGGIFPLLVVNKVRKN